MNGLCVNIAENMNRKIEGTGQIAGSLILYRVFEDCRKRRAGANSSCAVCFARWDVCQDCPLTVPGSILSLR